MEHGANAARSGSRWSFLRQPLVIFLNQPLIFRQELFAERSLHFVTKFVGQMAPNPAEHVFHIHTLRWLFIAPLDAIGAVARSASGRVAATPFRLCGAATVSFTPSLPRFVGLLEQRVQFTQNLRLLALRCWRGITPRDATLHASHSLREIRQRIFRFIVFLVRSILASRRWWRL